MITNFQYQRNCHGNNSNCRIVGVDNDDQVQRCEDTMGWTSEVLTPGVKCITLTKVSVCYDMGCITHTNSFYLM